MIFVSLASAAGLTLESSMVVGADAELQLEIDDGRARLAILNTGSAPFVVDWSRSWITPIGGAMSELVPGGADRPDPDVLVAPVEIAPQERITVRPVPRAWLVDGDENDDEQWASWARPGQITVELVVMNDQGEGTVKATWKQGGSSSTPTTTTGTPLAIPASPSPSSEQPRQPGPTTAVPPAPKPLPDPGLVERRREWDRRYYSYRRQERTARVMWMTGGAVGVLSGAIAGLNAAQIATAEEDPIDPEEPSRADHIQSSRTFAVLAGAGLLVATPTIIWDFSIRKKRRKLGPRP